MTTFGGTIDPGSVDVRISAKRETVFLTFESSSTWVQIDMCLCEALDVLDGFTKALLSFNPESIEGYANPARLDRVKIGLESLRASAAPADPDAAPVQDQPKEKEGSNS